MDLIKEFEKEIKELKEQKESIEKLREQSANLKEKRDMKKQELDELQDRKGAFYEDLSKEYDEIDSEFGASLTKEELAKRKLKRTLEEKKAKKLNELETKLSEVEKNRNSEYVNITQDEAKKLTEEKKKLEEDLELRWVTKEERLKLPKEKQMRYNQAKEQFVNNRNKLQEIEEKLEIANLYQGKKPIEKYKEIKEEMNVINNEFTLENLDNLIGKLNQKENEEFDKRKAIRADLDARTEKAIESNKKKILGEKPEDTNGNNSNNGTNTNNGTNNRSTDYLQGKDLITGIEIREGSNLINITKQNENGEKQTSQVEKKIEKILKNKKKIFAEPEIAEILNNVEPSKFKQFLLKRKLNPVILSTLNDNKQSTTILDYIEAIKNKENCENLEIKHDISHTVLKGNLKRMMKRVAKTENKIDGMQVIGLQESKIAGLLGKRKIKNIPSTIKEGIKLAGKIKAVEKAKSLSKNTFKNAIKVKNAVKEGLKKVAETYREDENLEKLEDKEDPNLEETKTQDGEEQEK